MTEPSVPALIARLTSDRTGAEAATTAFADWHDAKDERGADLLDALAAGRHTDALLRVIERHGLARPALFRLLIDADDIGDAEQATLVAVGLGLDNFAGTSRFTTWLHQVATNEAKMLIRSRERRPTTAVAEPTTAPFLARLSTMLADRDLVDRALAELPDDLRHTITLREIDGLDYADIASELGVEIGTVRSRLHRARARLVDELRDHLD